MRWPDYNSKFWDWLPFLAVGTVWLFRCFTALCCTFVAAHFIVKYW